MKIIPRPRLFDKRVSIFESLPVADGFGGFTTSSPTLVETRWCYVRNLNDVSAGQFRDEFGIATDVDILRFTFRKFDFDLQTQLLVYKGEPYNAIVANPNDQYEVSIDIIAVKVDQPTI